MCDSPFRVESDGAYYAVPCGRCPPCKKNRINDWVYRLQQEDKVHLSSMFVTLTYDTQSVPITPKLRMTLKPSDLKDFWKRLRYYALGDKIRYYACGEYGTERYRPHYHAIIFGLTDPKHIDKAWTSGTTHIDQVTPASIAYTAKYIQKPSRIPQYKGDDRHPEFARMSQGLGKNYITSEKIEYHHADLSRNYVTNPGGAVQRLPRYYRTKIYDEVQLKDQVKIILQAVNEAETDKQIQFYDTYGNNADYDAFTDSQRKLRYETYYKHQQPRQDL